MYHFLLPLPLPQLTLSVAWPGGRAARPAVHCRTSVARTPGSAPRTEVPGVRGPGLLRPLRREKLRGA